MRKIIITIIVTIFMIASFEKTQGQSVITEAHFPTANIHTGINAKLSVGIWRLELFGQIGQYLQLFEEMGAGYWFQEYPEDEIEIRGHYWPRFTGLTVGGAGAKFRITDRNRIKIGFISTLRKPLTFFSYVNDSLVHYSRYVRAFGNRWYRAYLGYIHRINLFQRVNLDLNVLYGFNWVEGWFRGWNNPGINPTVGVLYQFVVFGARLNYEIVRNLKLNVQLGYTRIYNVRYTSWTREYIESSALTRNLINFSIGIHYHIPIFGIPQQQTAPRPPRQRVAPHQRALPCPPGQMRHLRSWDRPSSVFNHPTAR